ncbi:MAG: NUDIX domain-containing protein [Brevinematales bacterium]|nr:NUDIX domain-containing protein [Brevinematales bacterium]
MDDAIRNSAKAIIIDRGRLLTIRCTDDDGLPFYLLPGGGQNKKESITDALIRECREEVGVGVIPGDLRYVRDYISMNHEFSHVNPEFHQVEYMFVCRIDGDGEPHPGHIMDTRQDGVDWLDLSKLAELALYPKILRELITPAGELTGPVYLGDVN